MSYVVLMRFADLQDGNRIYEAGDEYPRPGFEVSMERLAELAGSDNRVGQPLIVDVDAPCEDCVIEATEAPESAEQEADDKTLDRGVETPRKGRRSRQKE